MAPLVKHFHELRHKPEDIRWRILEKINIPDNKNGTKIPKKCEVFWIFSLNTFKNGLNSELPWENAIM